MKATDARRLERFERAVVDILDRLREELAEHAGAVDRERQHAGERAEPDRGDEDQREDDLVDAAHHVQHLAHEMIDRRMRRQIARREDADRQRKDHAEDRAPDRDLQAFDRGLPQLVDEREVRRHHAGDEVRHVGHAVEQILPVDLRADRRPPQDDQREHAPRPTSPTSRSDFAADGRPVRILRSTWMRSPLQAAAMATCGVASGGVAPDGLRTRSTPSIFEARIDAMDHVGGERGGRAVENDDPPCSPTMRSPNSIA